MQQRMMAPDTHTLNYLVSVMIENRQDFYVYYTEFERCKVPMNGTSYDLLIPALWKQVRVHMITHSFNSRALSYVKTNFFIYYLFIQVNQLHMYNHYQMLTHRYLIFTRDKKQRCYI